MRLSVERLSAEVLDHIKKWYAKCEEADCMPENGLTIGRLLDTIEASQAENEQLQAQVARVREALRKAREALITTIKGIDNKKIIPANADAAIELWRHKQQISNALAAIDKAIGGKEDV